jgi:hypothetical protein
MAHGWSWDQPHTSGPPIPNLEPTTAESGQSFDQELGEWQFGVCEMNSNRLSQRVTRFLSLSVQSQVYCIVVGDCILWSTSGP